MSRKWFQRTRRRLRRGPPRHYRGPEVAAILPRLDELMADGIDLAAYRERPALHETYLHPTKPTPHSRLSAEADALLAGRFHPADRWERQPLGFPPPWDSDPFGDDNWLSVLHGLEWLVPLVHADAGDPEKGYLNKTVLAIEDWILRNPFRGAPSRFSWHDHATAKRLRLFAWFWEQYRNSDDFDIDFARLLLASVYQHALYHMDGRNYRPDSNHGLEAAGALLSAAITFPSFRDAAEWEKTARQRLDQWLTDNLSPEGFHLEQSPSYHWFVLLRMAALDRFLRANERTVGALTDAVGRAAAVWPYLLEPDGTIPAVGDSGTHAPRDWAKALERRWGHPLPSPSRLSGGRDQSGVPAFVVSKRAGYAIFRSRAPGEAESERDLYVLFRCRAFSSPHCHHDALSFTLYGLGRDWIVDPGYLNYHEWDARRQYLRSARAHSLVLIGDRDFRVGRNDLMEWGSEEEADYVSAYHDLRQGRHIRAFRFERGGTVVLRDEVQPARRRPVGWRQLFQIAPDLEVTIVSPQEAHLIAPDGELCIIRQSVPGQWRVARGETRPRLQGWYSAGYGQWESGTTLFFHVLPGATEVRSELALQ
jgi:hypothetical protein